MNFGKFLSSCLKRFAQRSDRPPGKKLDIWLPDTWTDISHQNPGGPVTMCWDNSQAAGALQMSVAEYAGGRVPSLSEADLIGHAVNFGHQHKWGDLVNSSGGRCAMGLYGTAAYARTASTSADAPAYCQVWFLSNGRDFVFITFVAMQPPQQVELTGAQRIAEAVKLT